MFFCVFYCVSKSANNVFKRSLEIVSRAVENLTLQLNGRELHALGLQEERKLITDVSYK